MADSFVFYRSFYEALKFLDTETKCKAYNAICKYALDGELPTDEGMERAVFELVKPQIDANNRRRENGIKGKEYGKLGGRPKKTPKKPLNNPDKTPKKPQTNPKEPPNVNVNVNVNENVNVNDNENVNVNNISPLYPPVGNEVLTVQEKRFEEFWELYPRKVGKGDAKKKWDKIKPNSELFDKIINAVKENINHNSQWKRDNGQFIPHPATWLNQGRWDDDIPFTTNGTSHIEDIWANVH